MIYHVVKKEQWEHALSVGFYEADSLAIEGFIHTSQQHQVQGVLDRYYEGVSNLLLLHIDESKLTAQLEYELASSVNEEFPHIFGPLNADAVVNVTTI